ncbi:MAG: insulinase family protein [Holosporaceae bacterium]|nr:insulinase family protein [Holosporaceae bacterium]
MIKKILAALFFFFQVAWCGQPSAEDGVVNDCFGNKFVEHVVNDGYAAILCENFRRPIVVVGLVFDVGSLNAPQNKFGIAEIVAENIIHPETREQLRNLGISCNVTMTATYTEILAEMHPKHVKKFFEIMGENLSKFSVANLGILKKQMIIDSKLADYYSENIVKNAIFSHMKLKGKNAAYQIFNEKSLQSISEEDVEQFFAKNYLDCHLAVVVSGALSDQNLLESLPLMGAGRRRKAISRDICGDHCFKDIFLESRYIGRSLRYFYKIPGEDNGDFSAVFFHVFNYEAFKFFEKMHPLLVGYEVRDILDHGDCLRQICLRPRGDVSLEDLRRTYEIFVDRMRKKHFSPEFLAKVAKIRDYKYRILFADPRSLCQKIRDVHMTGKSINSICKIQDQIKSACSSALKTFAQKILGENLTFRITTRYNARAP